MHELTSAQHERVFVDDPARPGTCFVLSPEGRCLAGDADNLAFIQDFNRAVASRGVLGAGARAPYLIVSHAGRRPRLSLCGSIGAPPCCAVTPFNASITTHLWTTRLVYRYGKEGRQTHDDE